MNPTLARLRDALTKNKTALGALGVAAVAALAWRARSSSSSSTSSSGTSAGTSSSGMTGGYSSGGQVSTATGYDSTASDVYNALQPQIEQLNNLLTQTPTPIPVPVPDATDTRRDAIAGFYQSILGRAAGRGEINTWDATGADLDAIRSGIVRSGEATGSA